MSKINFGWLIPAALLAIAASLSFGTAAQAAPSPICPTTSNTNTDCAYIITLGAGNSTSGQAVAGANPYDGSEDSLVGLINNSGASFTGNIALTGSNIFGFDGDGICVYTPSLNAVSLSYCSSAQIAGTDPADYQGPLNTFTITNANTGFVDITGLAAGADTFFSLEGSPSSLNITLPPTRGVPEPITLSMFGIGLVGAVAMRRRKKKTA